MLTFNCIFIIFLASASFAPTIIFSIPRQESIPLFGDIITCNMVQLFVNRIQVDDNSQNCRLTQSEHYI